jgi:ABC-type amino acid transport substrate-binding protein
MRLRALAVLLVLGCARIAAAAPPVVEVKEGATLRVLVDPTEAPEMFSIQGGADPGLSREMLETFTRLHRMRLQVVAVKSWDDIIPALLRGDGDLITGIIATDARRKLIDFTVELLPSRHLAVTRKPQSVVSTVEALRAARVAAIGGSSWADAALAAGVPAARLQSYTDTPGVIGALKTGKADAAVMSLADFTLAAHRDTALQAGVFIGPLGSSAWGLRKQDTVLAASLDEFILNQRRSTAWSRLIVKYFGEDALSVLGRARKE